MQRVSRTKEVILLKGGRFTPCQARVRCPMLLFTAIVPLRIDHRARITTAGTIVAEGLLKLQLCCTGVETCVNILLIPHIFAL